MTTKCHKRKNRGNIRKKQTAMTSMFSNTSSRNEASQAPDDSAAALIFQNVIQQFFDCDAVQNSNNISLAFFELANAPVVRYRLPSLSIMKKKEEESHKTNKNDDNKTGMKRSRNQVETAAANDDDDKNNKERFITIRQNSQAQIHTGGVVWETSYLLLEYLLSSRDQHTNGRANTLLGPKLLEVGAGCGLLGLTLAAACGGQGDFEQVVLTETQQVLDTILRPNVKANSHHFMDKGSIRVSASVLDWNNYKQDGATFPKFDTIVGTDVVFSPSLVEPLLQTLQFLAHSHTVVYLCLQADRCPISFQLLQDKAPRYQFTWNPIDLTSMAQREQALSSAPSFVRWGHALECRLICMRVVC